jgi:hypothetical protein
VNQSGRFGQSSLNLVEPILIRKFSSGTFRDFWRFFEKEGFTLYRITPLGVMRIDRYHESEEFFTIANFIAVNKHSLDQFNAEPSQRRVMPEGQFLRCSARLRCLIERKDELHGRASLGAIDAGEGMPMEEFRVTGT